MGHRWSYRYLVLLGLLFGCAEEPARAPVAEAPATALEEALPSCFRDVTLEVGLDFVHQAPLDGTFYMPEIMGPGGAVFDADGDGLLDLYLVNGGPGAGETEATNRLFLQRPGGTFEDVTERAGVGDPTFGMGATVGDVDNDGDLDLYVTNYGKDRLYRNLGDGRFQDVTAAAGIDADGWSTTAGFFDFDLDGWLDLYVVRYVAFDPAKRCTHVSSTPEYCGPTAFDGVSDLLFRNLGDGRFQEIGARLGLRDEAGAGLGLALADFDGDGVTEIFVANDGEENHLWSAAATGFQQDAIGRGVAANLLGKVEASMGVALADLDGDLSLDVFLTHLEDETNTLYLNRGPGDFEDRVAASGLGSPSLLFTGFGVEAFDLELDGDLDLAVVNGKVRRSASRGGAGGGPVGEDPLREYREPNLLFENLGGSRFRKAECGRAFAAPLEVSRGLVAADLDRDGDSDLLVLNVAGPARLWRNEQTSGHHWIAVRAVDPNLGRDAVGALVRIDAGGHSQVRLISHVRSYLVGTEAVASFGLGEAAQVESAAVRWPSGDWETFGPLEADREVTLKKGEGKP